jgi:hypothetical protein
MTREAWAEEVMRACKGDARRLADLLTIVEALVSRDEFTLLESLVTLVRTNLKKVVASAA